MNRRTTLVANAGDLELISDEARSQGLSLGRMLGKVVAEYAHCLRRKRKPRLGTFESEGGDIAAAMEREDPAAQPFH
ncbi:MAG: hypothetical protein ACREN8_05785 [Candidatus Dormibacteraceae bacterium]